MSEVSTARREFLKFLAASPYVAALGGVAAFLDQRALGHAAQNGAEPIASPAEALNVFDFEEAARRKVLPGHWAYMASGVDDDLTLHANREVFTRIHGMEQRLFPSHAKLAEAVFLVEQGGHIGQEHRPPCGQEVPDRAAEEREQPRLARRQRR